MRRPPGSQAARGGGRGPVAAVWWVLEPYVLHGVQLPPARAAVDVQHPGAGLLVIVVDMRAVWGLAVQIKVVGVVPRDRYLYDGDPGGGQLVDKQLEAGSYSYRRFCGEEGRGASHGAP